jgi:hypothetical protein
MKASILPIFEYLVVTRRGDWTTAAQVIRDCHTTCPHKRLSELIALGFVEKVPNPYKKNLRIYRSVPEVKWMGVSP